jgi:O-antigen/teichoic acid export membrane protein
LETNYLNLSRNKIFTLGTEFLKLGFGKLIGFLGSIIWIRQITNLLIPEDYGLISIGLMTISLSMQLIWWPLQQSINRFFWYSSEENSLRNFLGEIFRIAVVICIFLVIIVCVISPIFILSSQIQVFLLFSFFSIIQGYNQLFFGLLNTSRKRFAYSLSENLIVWIRITILLIIQRHVLFVGKESVLTCYLFAETVLFIFQTIFLNKHMKLLKCINLRIFSVNDRWFKKILNYSKPFIFWGVLTWIQMSSSKWFLLYFYDSAEVGYYSVLYQLGYYPIVLMFNMFGKLVEPIIFKLAGSGKDTQRIKRIHRLNFSLVLILLVITVFFVLIMVIFGDDLLNLLVAKDYAIDSKYLSFMVFSAGLFSASQILSLSIMSSNKTKYLLIIRVISVSIGISINFLGAYLYGLGGVVFANILFSVIDLLLVCFFSNAVISEK